MNSTNQVSHKVSREIVKCLATIARFLTDHRGQPGIHNFTMLINDLENIMHVSDMLSTEHKLGQHIESLQHEPERYNLIQNALNSLLEAIQTQSHIDDEDEETECENYSDNDDTECAQDEWNTHQYDIQFVVPPRNTNTSVTICNALDADTPEESDSELSEALM